MVRFHPRSHMEDKKNTNYSIYKPVLVFYAKTTSWVIIPLLIAVILGKYASRSTGNEMLFFGAVVLGFIITIYGIYGEIKKYKKDLEIEDKNKNGDK